MRGTNHPSKMPSFHIHLRGRVQGVGFRPYVCRIAGDLRVSGTVSNGCDGVHIRFRSDGRTAEGLLGKILQNPPAQSIVTSHLLEKEEGAESYTGFRIIIEPAAAETDLLITPDLGICPDCRNEILEAGNRRADYAFTTCLRCGPRYSIMTALPYERENTTMADLPMCGNCRSEYVDITDRRHHSQTNGCPDCAIRMHWREREGGLSTEDPETVLTRLTSLLTSGGIAAVKGTGGYLLLCDATDRDAVMELRRRKHRPYKPLAVMYPDLQEAGRDVEMDEREADALTGSVAPIVLCRILDAGRGSRLAAGAVAPNLDRLGVMLPNSPLLQLIADRVGRPLVATSANLSGSPILYRDVDAVASLGSIADAILSFDRDIVVPQDDSVWRFTEKGRRIVLRRSRGMAPDLHPHTLVRSDETTLAAGADMKACFAIHRGERVYTSQYLGDLQDLRSQEAWSHTLEHLTRMLDVKPACILADKHKGYHSHEEARGLALRLDASFHEYQHHECHFAAVLAENGLTDASEPVLGIVWDGTGYGNDDTVWGGETFLYEKGRIERLLHLDCFPHLQGDKMSREPRLSAFSLLQHRPDRERLLRRHFSDAEWECYTKGLPRGANMLTSSMGRLIDGVTALIGLRTHNRYEAQAAMELEALAGSVEMDIRLPYLIPLRNDRIDWRPMVDNIIGDIEAGAEPAMVARRFLFSLARLVVDMAVHLDVPRIALSGGVFQNALLVDMVLREADGKLAVHLHDQLSPNDECIAYGQLARHRMERLRESGTRQEKITETKTDVHVSGHTR